MAQPSSPQAVVRCPTCGKDALFAPENAYRPFCSKRCKLIDLGQWAAEEFRIPESTPPADADETPD